MGIRKPSDGRDPKPAKDRLKETREALQAVRDGRRAKADEKSGGE